jgi:hypothetical protein
MRLRLVVLAAALAFAGIDNAVAQVCCKPDKELVDPKRGEEVLQPAAPTATLFIDNYTSAEPTE